MQSLKFALTIVIVLFATAPTHAAKPWQRLLLRSDSLFSANQGDSARVAAESALRLTVRKYGAEDSSAASCWHRIGMCYRWRSDLAAADSCLLRALEIRERTCGPEDPRTGATLDELARVYKLQNQRDKSEIFYRRALRIREEYYGVYSDQVVRTLEQFGELLQLKGLAEEAITKFRQVAASYESNPRPLGTAFGRCYDFLGFLYRDRGQFVEAAECHRKSYDYYTRFAPENVAVRANCLNSLSQLYNLYGRYDQGESCARQALDMLATIPPSAHVHPPMVATNLGNALIQLGKYDEAMEVYQRQIESHPDMYYRWMALLLNGQAQVCEQRGQFEEALNYHRQSVAVLEEHPETASATIDLMNELTEFCLQHEFYMDATETANRALKMGGEDLTRWYPRSAECILQLAELHLIEHRITEAESLLVIVKPVQDSAVAKSHPRHAEFVAKRAELESKLGKAEIAAATAGEALRAARSAYGETHPDLAFFLQICSGIEAGRSHDKEAIAFAREAFELRFAAFLDGVKVLPEPDALTFGNRFRESTSHYLSVLFGALAVEPGLANEIARVAFSAKARVTDEFIARYRITHSAPDSVTAALWESLRTAQFQLASLTVRAHAEADLEKYRRELESARQRCHQFEAELGIRSQAFRDEEKHRDLQVGDIVAHLPDSCALVEYVCFKHTAINERAEERYAAVVLTPDRQIRCVNLGSVSTIDSAVALYRSQLQQFENLNPRRYQRYAKRLYDLVWKPVAPSLGKANLVFISPDGMLNLVSFAGLPESDAHYLIERFAVHYLASARDLIPNLDSSEAQSSLVIFADPDYDASVEVRIQDREMAISHVKGQPAIVPMDILALRSRFSDLPLERLPWTKLEADWVREKWHQTTSDSIVARYGSLASEDEFKACANGCRVLYLATHGFGAKTPVLNQANAQVIGESTAMMSKTGGLYFAGANLLGAGCDSAGLEDGVLLMEEIAALDLRGTELVILSACESGLGNVFTGEGMFALRRAFQIAGAHTVVSTLWQVDDQSTAELIVSMFSQKRENIAQALRDAALLRIDGLRRAKKDDHPYFWAGLFAMGGWYSTRMN